MADDEVEVALSNEAISKYKEAGAAVRKALDCVLSECKKGARIRDLCEKGDSYIRENVGVVKSNAKKKKNNRGVAFPTCLSVNNIVCHFSPLATDKTALDDGDILKIDMGCQIDGYIAAVAHTHVLQQDRVTGRTADVIKAAATAAEVALKLVRPGNKNHDVTEACNKVAAAYNCNMVKAVLSHQMTKGVIAGKKVILSVSEPKIRVADAEFKENEVYAIDIVISTGDGELEHAEEHQTTIFRLKEAVRVRNKDASDKL